MTRSLRQNPVATIEGKLRRLVADSSEPCLPSIHALARHFHCGTSVVSRAMARLRDGGLLDYRQGKRAVITHGGREPPAPGPAPVRTPASERLYEGLRARIAAGELRAGSALPKIKHCALSEHVSEHTVAAAYRRLREEGVATKTGRAFLVGRRKPPSATAGAVQRILLVMDTPSSWQGMYASERTGSFCRTFTDEMQQFGLQLNPVLSGEYRGGEALPSGMLAAGDCIRGMGQRYAGALIATTMDLPRSVEPWIDMLTRHREPVVVFDRNDGGLLRAHPASLVTRCTYSERALVEQAASFLHERGHRNVLYVKRPDTPNGDTWQRRRGELLAETGRTLTPPMRIIAREALTRTAMASPETVTSVAADLAALQTIGNIPLRTALGFVHDAGATLLRSYGHFVPPGNRASRHAPEIACLAAMHNGPLPEDCLLLRHTRNIEAACNLLPLLDKRVTAVIAPSDRHARSYVSPWLQGLGYSVPQDVSLLSFDNRYRELFLPLTTVDPGFAHLGYQALHAILGDIPLSRDRDGRIASRPYVVDNGSVVAPA